MKSGQNPPREDPDLKENLYKIRQELLTNLSDNRPLWKNNLSNKERSGLQEIKEDPSVHVHATDKNLGPALVSTEWVKQETLKHLNDTKTYSKVTADDWTYRRLKVTLTKNSLIVSRILYPPTHISFSAAWTIFLVVSILLNSILFLRFISHL